MKVSKSGLFLFELIVVIFLFTISSAVCISIFAKSYTFSTDSENLTMSSMKAETVAEVFKKSDGDADAIIEAVNANSDTYNMIMSENNGSDEFIMNFYFDEMWENTDDHNAVYTITLTKTIESWTKTGELVSGNITVNSVDKTDKKVKKEILNMDAKKYIASSKTDDDDEAGDDDE